MTAIKAAINISTLRVILVAKLWSQISQERSEFELRNDEEETQQEELLCVRHTHTASHIFSPNWPLCENTEQKQH